LNHKEIIGRTVLFEYSDESYQIDFLNESTLRWTRVKGEKVGEGNEERYVYSRLADELMLVTWIEDGGPGLSNALNFAKLTVTTHANMGRDVFENPGKLIIK